MLRQLLISGGLILVVVVSIVSIYFASSHTLSGISAPSTPTVAVPTFDALVTSAVATLASVDNFTIFKTSFGPLRYFRIIPVGNGQIVAHNFIVFPPATIRAADLPANDGVFSVLGYQAHGNRLLLGPTVASVGVLVFGDGSLLIGQDIYGLNPIVEMAPFDAAFVGAPFSGLQEDLVWRTTYGPGPLVTPFLVAATNLTRLITASTATAYVTAWNTTHSAK